MKEIKFKKNETEKQLVVEVTLPRRKYVSEPVVTFSNSEMNEYLKEQNIDISAVALEKSPEFELTSYADKRNKARLKGSWVYNKEQSKPKVQKKVNKRKAQAYNKGEDKTGG